MTTETEYTRLMRTVRPRLPGALDSAIQHETFDVLDTFFNKTNIWQESVRISAVTTKTSYDFEPETSSATILRLISLKNADDVDVAGTMAVPGTLVLASLPSEAQYLYAVVSLTVTEPLRSDDYPNVPEWVFLKYRKVITDGVLGHMMSQVAKPYTNERLAIYHMRAFNSGVATAKQEALHKNLYGGQRWQFPSSFTRMTRTHRSGW